MSVRLEAHGDCLFNHKGKASRVCLERERERQKCKIGAREVG